MRERPQAGRRRDPASGPRLLLSTLLAAAGAACAALVEPARWPDLASLVLSGLPAGIIAGSAAALAARLSGAATSGGAVGGGLLAAAVWSASGWRGFVLMGAFVGVASAATGWRASLRRGGGGSPSKAEARNGRQAVANMGAAALLSFLTPASLLDPVGVRAGFAAALAAALSDTVATEMGQGLGGRPVLITTWRAVPPGTGGGVSLPGTLAGLASAFLLAAAAWGIGWIPAGAVLLVGLAGFAGSLIDSLLGATLERRGLVENDSVNFLATVSAALGAIALWGAPG